MIDPRRIVVRRFSPSRLITGLAAVAVGAGIQVVVVGPSHGHFSGRGLLAMGIGLVAAAIGLTLVFRPRADFCARCGVRLIPNGLRLRPGSIPLAAAALRAGDPAEALSAAGAPLPEGEWVTVWYCPRCRSTIVWDGGAERIVATGGEGIVAAMTGRK